jgi:tRNA A37 threonylcarbamoyladenosine modification protein TsaB
MLILAFDTATDVATSALVSDGEVLGERSSRASTVLEDVDAL